LVKPSPKRRPAWPFWVRLVLTVCALGIFLLGYYWGNQYRYGEGPPAISGIWLSPPQPLPNFTLDLATGGTFGQQDLRDHWTLLAFAPIESARGQLAANRLMAVAAHLGNQPRLQEQLQLLLLAAHQDLGTAWDFRRLSPKLHLLFGEGVAPLAEALGASPEAPDQAGFYLIAPDGKGLAFFPPGLSPAAIAADLLMLSDWPLELLVSPHG